MPTVVLTDADVLVSRTLRDYIIYTAGAGAFELRWSEEILDEMIRNLIDDFAFTSERAALLERRLSAYLPLAATEVSSTALQRAASTRTAPKDQHVLAAAFSAQADYLLTENTRDFDTAALGHAGLTLTTTAELLAHLAEEDPYAVSNAHKMTLQAQRLPEYEILDKLSVATGSIAVEAIESALKVTTGNPRLTAHGYPPKGFTPRRAR